MPRTKAEILVDILNACGGGATKYMIVYRANLNHKLVRAYLDQALERGLLQTEGSKYSTTKIGREMVLLKKENA
jgi:predicted transcriptional regulator